MKQFLGFVVSWLSVSCFLVSRLLGFLASCFQRFLITRLLGFNNSWFIGFKVSEIYQISILCFLGDIDPISKIFKMLFDGSSRCFGARLLKIATIWDFQHFEVKHAFFSRFFRISCRNPISKLDAKTDTNEPTN